MKRPYIYAVIGKNFGDEGKGLAVDFLSARASEGKVLVIRHNGGAQSGHTVDLKSKRFVFHELSSGSFRGADTLWADTFFPDLYKLGEEAEEFREISGFVPEIYADPQTQITLIDDVLLNMAAEESRGSQRHGSCGMGIYEAQCRTEAGFGISVGELFHMEVRDLVAVMQKVRKEYLPKRMEILNLSKGSLGEYEDLLRSEEVLQNAALQILENLRYVRIAENMPMFLQQYGRVIFENGQGLLLDERNERYAPHVTASRTGLSNIGAFLKRYGYELDEVIYVTRSYVTRHGAGPLTGECNPLELGICVPDLTNVENQWQGRLRYAKHGSIESFVEAVREDLREYSTYRMHPLCPVLMVTHLNETHKYICMEPGYLSIEELCREHLIQELFQKVYISETPYQEQIHIV